MKRDRSPPGRTAHDPLRSRPIGSAQAPNPADVPGHRLGIRRERPAAHDAPDPRTATTRESVGPGGTKLRLRAHPRRRVHRVSGPTSRHRTSGGQERPSSPSCSSSRAAVEWRRSWRLTRRRSALRRSVVTGRTGRPSRPRPPRLPTPARRLSATVRRVMVGSEVQAVARTSKRGGLSSARTQALRGQRFSGERVADGDLWQRARRPRFCLSDQGTFVFRWSEELDEPLPFTPRRVRVPLRQSGSKGAGLCMSGVSEQS